MQELTIFLKPGQRVPDMTTLKSNFNESLNLFKEVLLNPPFPEKNFERVKKEQLLQFQQEQFQPFSMALRTCTVCCMAAVMHTVIRQLALAQMHPNYEPIRMMNRILGGEFTSRLNMNLREDKHWAYGAYSFTTDTKGPGFFSAYAPVQIDKIKEAVSEMLKELTQYTGDKTITQKEFDKVQKNAVMQLPGQWETNNNVLFTLQSVITFERGLNYLKNYPSMLQQLKLTDIQKAAAMVVKNKNLTWVIVGDKVKIEKRVLELNLGPVKYIESEEVEVGTKKVF